MVPNRKITYELAEEIRHKWAMGISQRRLARDYNLTQATIWALLERRTWKHPEGPPKRQPGPMEPRFWEKVKVCEHGQHCPYCCWDWQAATFTNSGYGAFRTGAKQRRAHCVAWELHHTKPLPAERWCLHYCNRPLCVNPNHLYAGTPQQNSDDRKRSGIKWTVPPRTEEQKANAWQRIHPERIKRGEDHHGAKWTNAQRDEMRTLHKQKVPRHEIAKRFGISLGGLDHILYPPKS